MLRTPYIIYQKYSQSYLQKKCNQLLHFLKVLKFQLNLASNLKSWKSFFGKKMDYELTHMPIRVNPKQKPQIMIEVDKPLNQQEYFKQRLKNSQKQFVLQIKIIYQGG